MLALGQDVDPSLLEGVPGLGVNDGVVKVAPNMMTGHPGIFAGASRHSKRSKVVLTRKMSFLRLAAA